MRLWRQYGNISALKKCCSSPTTCTCVTRASHSTRWSWCLPQRTNIYWVACQSLSDQVPLVIIIDSIGYAQGIAKVMEEVGCSLPALAVECLQQCDEKHQYDKVYHSSMEIRHQCGMLKQQQIINHLIHHKKGKKDGCKYGPGIAVAEENAETSNNKCFSNEAPNKMDVSTSEGVEVSKKQRTKRPLVICPLEGCKLLGHKSAVSKRCRLNPNYVGP